MTELNDNPELSAFSSGLLLLLSSTTPPREYIGLILDEMITSVRSTSVRPLESCFGTFFTYRISNFSHEKLR